MSPGWSQLWLVMAGGALGAAGRWWLGGALLRQLGSGMPWGTLAANLGGSLAVGFLAVWLDGRGAAAAHWRAFIIVGVLGALTTYSALMLECLLLAREERQGAMLGYLGATLAGGLFLAWAGARLAGALKGQPW